MRFCASRTYQDGSDRYHRFLSSTCLHQHGWQSSRGQMHNQSGSPDLASIALRATAQMKWPSIIHLLRTTLEIGGLLQDVEDVDTCLANTFARSSPRSTRKQPASECPSGGSCSTMATHQTSRWRNWHEYVEHLGLTKASNPIAIEALNFGVCKLGMDPSLNMISIQVRGATKGHRRRSVSQSKRLGTVVIDGDHELTTFLAGFIIFVYSRQRCTGASGLVQEPGHEAAGPTGRLLRGMCARIKRRTDHGWRAGTQQPTSPSCPH